jgi:hypothetical protein
MSKISTEEVGRKTAACCWYYWVATRSTERHAYTSRWALSSRYNNDHDKSIRGPIYSTETLRSFVVLLLQQLRLFRR